LRREKSWVLPKGKLYPGQHALAAAEREVMEETGYDVSVHGFLGTMLYSEAAGRTKIVQFWQMRAIGRPKRELMPDVKTVKWLSLKQAIEMLTRAHEKVFLANVGPIALQAAEQSARGNAKTFVYKNANRRVHGRAVAPSAARLWDERQLRAGRLRP
jgi:8-oxo-dGTP diphosphatase